MSSSPDRDSPSKRPSLRRISDRPFSQATVQEDTPAQQRIAAAQLQIRTDPKKVQAYNELASAFLRRTRETADPRYLKDADAALAQGLKLDPTDFQLQKNSGSPHVESS